MTEIIGQDETYHKYIDGWSEMMVNIWQDRLRQLGVLDTGNLYNSVKENPTAFIEGTTIISHKFVEYGIYVDAGVGKGFRHDNKGDLGFNPIRQPKPWFAKKYYASWLNLRDAVADILGKKSMSCITTKLKIQE